MEPRFPDDLKEVPPLVSVEVPPDPGLSDSESPWA